jgi:hypothetical protein
MSPGRCGGARVDFMNATMMNQTEQKKGILILFQGPRRGRSRASVEIRLDGRMRSAFARLEGADGNVPSKGVYKVRAGEQHPLRVTARRLVEAHQAQAPVEQALGIIEELRSWVLEDLYKVRAS